MVWRNANEAFKLAHKVGVVLVPAHTPDGEQVYFALSIDGFNWEQNWSEQRMIELGDEDFGCLWAPDVIYDQIKNDYVIHWSSAHASNNYEKKAIYYSRTKDFESFTKPQLLCRKEDSGVIDSAIYEENGMYYPVG